MTRAQKAALRKLASYVWGSQQVSITCKDSPGHHSAQLFVGADKTAAIDAYGETEAECLAHLAYHIGRLSVK